MMSKTVFVDGGVDPVDDGVVDLLPLGGVLGDGRRGTDEVIEPELAEDGLEENAPLPIVRRGEVEEDENMRADVHLLHDGGRSRLRSVWKGLRGDGGAGGGVHRRRHGGASRHAGRSGCGS